MSAHNMFLQAFMNGAYQSVDADALEGSAVKVTRGMTEDGGIRPSKIEFRMNNLTDNYRPTNPAGTLYKQWRRGTFFACSIDGKLRAAGELTSFQPDQDPEFQVGPPQKGVRWVDCQAEGLLARVSGWSEPVRSPLQQKYSSLASARGYWTMEDGRNATQLSNQYPGGQPGYFVGATPAADSGPPGANTAVAAVGTSRMGGSFAPMSSTSGFQFSFSARVPATLSVGSYQPFIQWQTSNGNTFYWEIGSTGYNLRVVAPDGTALVGSNVGFGAGVDPKKWIVFRFKVTASAGTVSVECAWYPQDGSTLYGYTPTYAAASPGGLKSWRQITSANTDGALFSHIIGLEGVSDSLTATSVTRAFNAYLGETAGDRFLRLLGQAGVGCDIVGTAASTAAMGRQKSDTLLNQLKEIMATDDGLIFDADNSQKIRFRTRASMINQTPVLSLTYPTDLTPPLVETIDPLDVFNQFTVSQRDGGEATATLTTGVLGTGLLAVRKGSIEVNVLDEAQLPNLAGYQLARSTIDTPRYPTIVIDMEVVSGAVATAANLLDEGDLVVLTGRTPEQLFLLVYGMTEICYQTRRILTLTCVPADTFKVGVYGAATSRYDVAASTLAAAATAAATSLSLTGATTADTWSTTALPYDFTIEGERVTVTAMTAPAGTGPYTQTATVTRAVNGVSKALPVSAEVHIVDRDTTRAGRVRYAL